VIKAGTKFLSEALILGSTYPASLKKPLVVNEVMLGLNK